MIMIMIKHDLLNWFQLDTPTTPTTNYPAKIGEKYNV